MFAIACAVQPSSRLLAASKQWSSLSVEVVIVATLVNGLCKSQGGRGEVEFGMPSPGEKGALERHSRQWLRYTGAQHVSTRGAIAIESSLGTSAI